MNDVDYVVNTLIAERKGDCVNINMLKPYCEKGQVEVPVITVASCADTQENKEPDQQEEVRKSPRLRSSEVLLN